MKGKQRGGIFAIFVKTLTNFFPISGESFPEVKTSFPFYLIPSSDRENASSLFHSKLTVQKTQIVKIFA
jgi:hypothetical protein